jgi:hypothetical protein
MAEPLKRRRKPRVSTPAALEETIGMSQAVQLRLAGWDYSEISSKLGCKQNTVRQRISRAVKRAVQPYAEQARLEEIARLDRLFRRPWRMALDPNTSDHSALLATRSCLEIIAKRMALHGLDKHLPDVDARTQVLVDLRGHPDELIRSLAAMYSPPPVEVESVRKPELPDWVRLRLNGNGNGGNGHACS